MGQKPDWCGPRQAAKRLGISVDEVLDLIATGELPAVTYMDNNRLLVHPDSLQELAQKARKRDARPD
jgi:excisionase family DNA binding protein